VTIVAIETQPSVPLISLLTYVYVSTIQNSWVLPWARKNIFFLLLSSYTVKVLVFM